jgi:hypothetical protein
VSQEIMSSFLTLEVTNNCSDICLPETLKSREGHFSENSRHENNRVQGLAPTQPVTTKEEQK